MKFKEKTLHILSELKTHAPFTLAGAAAGIAFMLIFRNIDKSKAELMFGIFHPAHVFLSAMVTASVFTVHYHKKKFIKILLVGYFGSIGVATLSDSIVPYIGEKLFSLDVPTHHHHHHDPEGETAQAVLDTSEEHSETAAAEEHLETAAADHHIDSMHEEHEHDGHLHHEHATGQLHLGFVEEWYVVHPVAIFGIIIAWIIPRSKCPHAAHVLISTWASSAHILMNSSASLTAGTISQIFGILFIAVWLPCCISDIIFPLLFVDSDLAKTGMCACHSGGNPIQEKPDEQR